MDSQPVHCSDGGSDLGGINKNNTRWRQAKAPSKFLFSLDSSSIPLDPDRWQYYPWFNLAGDLIATQTGTRDKIKN